LFSSFNQQGRLKRDAAGAIMTAKVLLIEQNPLKLIIF
jgi:hypothetical protein